MTKLLDDGSRDLSKVVDNASKKSQTLSCGPFPKNIHFTEPFANNLSNLRRNHFKLSMSTSCSSMQCQTFP